MYFSCGESLDKEVVTTYPNGIPMKEHYYRWRGNTRELVKEIRYFQDGSKEIEGQWSDGKKHGTWEYWHRETGEKWLHETYKNGLLNGKVTEWYKSGEKNYEGVYKNGKPDGKWSFWDENGNKIKTAVYENGNILKQNK